MKRKYWILTKTYECLWCGNKHVDKQRMYTPKPESWYDRNIWIHEYDYCSSL